MQTQFLAFCLAGGIIGLSAASAQPTVLLTGAGSSNPADCRFVDVQTKLMGTGQFATVDILPATAMTPTLAQLQDYDVLLVWSNFQFASASEMGNVLADYVDAGGAVVIAVFTNASIPLAGRWTTGGYEVIIADSGQTQGSGGAQLGIIHEPAHPIMVNVNTFDGGSQSFRPTVTDLTPGSIRIADWTDGRVLVAVGDNPKRVDLGFYPPSSDCTSSWWVSATDGTALLANSLLFAAGSGDPPCYANCDGSTNEPILTVDDFTCFINEFAAAQALPHEQQVTHYANCDGSTSAPALTVDDFTCFINEFAQGCE